MNQKPSRTYRIERSREMRLWIRDFIIPATVGVVTLVSNPQVAAWLDYKKDQFNKKVEEVKSKRSEIKIAK